MRLEVRFQAVPVEGLRAFLEPLGYRFDWGPELEGIGFHWLKQPLSGTGVRATYFPDGDEGLLVIETDGRASVADATMHQTKCFNSLKALRDNGVTVLFVSHDVHLVRNLCKKTLWLDQGKVVKYGDTVDVTAAYLEFMYSENKDALLSIQTGDSKFDDQNSELQCVFEPINRWGSSVGIISFAKIYNEGGIPADVFNVGEKMKIVVAFSITEDINLECLSVAFSIKNSLGIDIIVGTTYDQEEPITFERRAKKTKVSFEFVNCLNKGDYILNIALEDRANEVPQYYDYIEGAGFFKSVTDKKIFGMISVPVNQEILYIGD